MQVLGNGSRGCPKSIFLFSDFNRYMFNCGEGTQRLATEHRVKLSRLEHLFCTYRCWENIGGLPGMALTLRDIGVPKIVIHGPPGLQKLFIMTKGFMMTKDMNIEKRTYTDEPFTDNMMTVNYVPIFGAFRNMPAPSDSDNEAEAAPSEDYYAYQNKYVAKGNLPKNTEDTQTTKQNFQLEPEPDREVAVAFVCKPHVRPGQLDFEKCVKYKIPPGPLLGQLKQGQDVVLTDGTVVKSEDVTAPDQPGRVFIGYSMTACIKINNDKYRKETLAMTGAREQLEQLGQTMEDLSVPTSSGRAEEKETEEYPEVVFLGTGSCIPNKARNVSAIITHVSFHRVSAAGLWVKAPTGSSGPFSNMDRIAGSTETDCGSLSPTLQSTTHYEYRPLHKLED
ncbi:PREDICTED: ribonuclease Z, mitochondrial-like [Priapulus caudatus]|uniref:ribonuclease Z n=1 Tax=Priapulus caudatus TaxID=37621 RepID=A0ABM1EN60_PRICU|nr:PREDICTED: ribonuclease Z, mitochondrial-like [Priapulus caudatus]